ncbi:MAG: BadF/BadG/BcrA/BcrD ATPase family protein [Ignavibacteriaceae bacterium]
MKYLIGIDGGGTKSDCAVADQEGNILFETKGAPSNFLIEGTEKVAESILDLINKCKHSLSFDYSDIESILIGTAGAGRRNDAERLKKSFIEFSNIKGINFKNFFVESDARIALEGAFSGMPGAILICGTGSIMFGKALNGDIHRVGGFGRLIGDEGSGQSIGRKGLNAVSKQFDGRGSFNLISKYLEDKFEINSAEKLITEVYRNNFDIASIAPAVISAAENNDETAMRIIDEESDELLKYIYAIKKKLNLNELKISFLGGLINNENFYSKKLKEKIMNEFPGIKIQAPQNSPAMGAILMAKQIIAKNQKAG